VCVCACVLIHPVVSRGVVYLDLFTAVIYIHCFISFLPVCKYLFQLVGGAIL